MEECQNIQVVLRIRPLNQREKLEESNVCIQVNDDQSVLVQTKPFQKKFSFDYVADEQCTNEDFFYQSGGMQMSEQCVEGFNGCLFAYGQTGSGKTHTMVGELSLQITGQTGLQPRVIQHLLTLIRRQSKSIGSFYCARCSFLEIYNENIIDLLNPGEKTLKIRQDVKKGIFVENLTEEEVVTFDEVQQIMLKGNKNRKCASTLMNAQSSRSHSIFQLSLESKTTKDGISVIKTSKINFVDLAGSERQNKTGAEGERLKEANCINKSLLQLGTVISTLIKSANNTLHIPYRNSKLTHFLQDSLGGNSKTVMIAAVSPASTQIFETLSTLNFTQCVKLVKNQAKVNEKLGGVEVQRLEKEIALLRNELLRYKNMSEKENLSLTNNIQINSDLKIYLEKKFIRPLSLQMFQTIQTIQEISNPCQCKTNEVSKLDLQTKQLNDVWLTFKNIMENCLKQCEEVGQMLHLQNSQVEQNENNDENYDKIYSTTQNLQEQFFIVQHQKDKLEQQLREIKQYYQLEMDQSKYEFNSKYSEAQSMIQQLQEENQLQFQNISLLQEELETSKVRLQNEIQNEQKQSKTRIQNLTEQKGQAYEELEKQKKIFDSFILDFEDRGRIIEGMEKDIEFYKKTFSTISQTVFKSNSNYQPLDLIFKSVQTQQESLIQNIAELIHKSNLYDQLTCTITELFQIDSNYKESLQQKCINIDLDYKIINQRCKLIESEKNLYLALLTNIKLALERFLNIIQNHCISTKWELDQTENIETNESIAFQIQDLLQLCLGCNNIDILS